MEWILYGVMIIFLIDIEEKIRKMNRNNFLNQSQKNKSAFAINEYENKRVSIILKDIGLLADEYLSANKNIVGEITDFDDEWIVYKYYNKTKKETILQYIRISYIESIDEVK